jgi:hypothetical protein
MPQRRNFTPTLQRAHGTSENFIVDFMGTHVIVEAVFGLEGRVANLARVSHRLFADRVDLSQVCLQLVFACGDLGADVTYVLDAQVVLDQMGV